MAAYDYSTLANTAISLIDRFGRTIIRRRATKSGDNWNPTISYTDTNIIGVSLGYKANEIDGNLIKATDKKILTYDEVIVSDKIVDNSIVYEVISVDTINPGDTILIYKVQIRR
ncbi:MAG: hypothetical protein M0R77_19130 [Gammaproteobacteria bacterium]|nr:hypothetical protein [Gammaproteobacteria bacterium]